MAITQRDLYVAEKRARASALRQCASMIEPTYRRNGHEPYSSMIGAANACDDAAEWAEGMTAQQFNSERYRP